MEAPLAVHKSDAGSSLPERTVEQFARLLGSQDARKSALSGLFSSSVSDDEVVLVLPSLDMRLAEGQNAALPAIGESNMERDDRPLMAASVLTAASTAATNSAAEMESSAAQSMDQTTSWTRSTAVYASHAVSTNASSFFSNLIDSRLRSWTLLLLRHSLSTGDNESRSRLLGMLSASIKVNKVETEFKTLPLPASAKGQPKEADVILPLLFSVVLHLSVQDKNETVTLRAPGTISAFFVSPPVEKEGSLKKVIVRLDSGAMLSSMVDQARVLVFKAVATATKSSLPPSAVTGSQAGTDPAADPSAEHSQVTPTPTSQPHSLSGFRSALNISSNEEEPEQNQSPRLQKARSSALRLNSILYGNNNGSKSSSTGARRMRSVKWDSPLQLPTLSSALAPNPKKQRVAQSAAKLKSFKSFGRPHAGDFGSGPRNATFGDYGGRTHLWGRDGRLAHHPSPMQAETPTGMTGVADRNATFDLNHLKQSSHLTTASPASSPAPSSAMPRTTTNLEQWLLKKTTSGGGF